LENGSRRAWRNEAAHQFKGFRPGKALSLPQEAVRQVRHGEVVEAAVTEGSQKAISDNKLKPALQPRIEPVGT
jgi:trigger factor